MTSASQSQMDLLAGMVNKLQGWEEDLEQNHSVIQMHRLARLRSVLHELDQHYARQIFPKASEAFQYGIRIHEFLYHSIRFDEERLPFAALQKDLQQYNLVPEDWAGLYRSIEDANSTLFLPEISKQEITEKSLLQDLQEASGNAKWPKSVYIAWKSAIQLYAMVILKSTTKKE